MGWRGGDVVWDNRLHAKVLVFDKVSLLFSSILFSVPTPNLNFLLNTKKKNPLPEKSLGNERTKIRWN